VEYNGPTVHVVDYKTGDPNYAGTKLKRPDEMEAGGEYWRQMVFYKILIENQNKYAWEMTSGEISFVEKDSKKDKYINHRFNITADEVNQVKRELSAVYKKINQKVFNVGCADKDCEWCKFVRDNGLSIL
jgi:DNA helicase-2/ATP-dependent DNA helicase PcrA